jgi:hypothetical protein
MDRAAAHQLVDAAPEGDGWLHEIKFDGYRMHARLDRGGVRLLTRTGLDWTHKYPAIAQAVSSLGAGQAYLDGELCGVFPDGITSFGMIQAVSDAGNAAGLVYFIFDLLHLGGDDTALRPLIDRKGDGFLSDRQVSGGNLDRKAQAPLPDAIGTKQTCPQTSGFDRTQMTQNEPGGVVALTAQTQQILVQTQR